MQSRLSVTRWLLAGAACVGGGASGCSRAPAIPAPAADIVPSSPLAPSPQTSPAPGPPPDVAATPVEPPAAPTPGPISSADPERETRARVYALLGRLWRSQNLTDREAVREIGAFGVAAVPHLIAALDSGAEGVAGTAAFVLAETRADPALYVPHIRDLLAKYLSEASSPRAAYAEHRHTIATCISILRTLGPAGGPAVPQVAALMDNPDPEVRMYCLLVFQDVGPPAAIALPAIRRELTSRTAPLRRHALRAIARIGPAAEDVLLDLMLMLTVPNAAEHRWELFEALCALGPAAKPVIPALRRAVGLPEADFSVGAATALALLEPSGDQIPARLIGALASPEAAERLAGVRGLKMLGARCVGSVPLLIARLADSAREVRQLAAEALGTLGPTAAPALAALRQLSTDPDEIVRNVAIWATDRIEGR